MLTFHECPVESDGIVAGDGGGEEDDAVLEEDVEEGEAKPQKLQFL